uniref:hypothetical protein n=1 Tax=Pararhizobium sp. IMCC3301 TaxID=3067904 RepID=UPI0027408FAE|nr:hypothetical protein [Pararhizobium sp. IMCC3301]
MDEQGGDNNGDRGNGHLDAAEAEDFEDGELEAILRESVGTLIALLDPVHGEPVWRAEILDQSPSEIAAEMRLSEREVTKRLRAGRRKLLHLTMLTLHPTLQE